MRGEDGKQGNVNFTEVETPPHAWGRLLYPLKGLGRLRNTPTCVGKTPSVGVGRGPRGKHPHMRGEDNSRIGDSIGRQETPPHAWGRHDLNTIHQNLLRNTPTCVGKTVDEHYRSFPREKHPHMRGEDFLLSRKFRNYIETPPHAWGRQLHNLCDWITSRNTPTCVGKTLNDH